MLRSAHATAMSIISTCGCSGSVPTTAARNKASWSSKPRRSVAWKAQLTEVYTRAANGMLASGFAGIILVIFRRTC